MTDIASALEAAVSRRGDDAAGREGLAGDVAAALRTALGWRYLVVSPDRSTSVAGRDSAWVDVEIGVRSRVLGRQQAVITVGDPDQETVADAMARALVACRLGVRDAYLVGEGSTAGWQRAERDVLASGMRTTVGRLEGVDAPRDRAFPLCARSAVTLIAHHPCADGANTVRAYRIEIDEDAPNLAAD